MRVFIAIVAVSILFSCNDQASRQERMESENYAHVLSIHSCDSLNADSIYQLNAKFSIDSTTRKPNSIFEVLQILDSASNKYTKHMFATCPTAMFHFGLGNWMRNRWGLWKGGPLAEDVRQTFSIQHPDDMSGVLLDLNSACCSSDEMRIVKFFEAYRQNLQDSASLDRISALEMEIKKWKASEKR